MKNHFEFIWPTSQPGQVKSQLELDGISVKWDENFLMNVSSRLTRMEIVLTISPTLVLDILFCKIVRRKLNFNKPRQILKVAIARIITANTTNKSFQGAMLVCYCATSCGFFFEMQYFQNLCFR